MGLHDKTAKEVALNAKKNMENSSPKYTYEAIKGPCQKIASESWNKYQSIQKAKEAAYSTLNGLGKLYMNKESDLAKLNASRDIIKYKGELIKGYTFIMKTRHYITGEKVSYLIMMDSFSNNPTLGELSLEQLIPHISMSVDRSGKFKLQLLKTDNILKNTLKTESETANDMKKAAYNNIISNYKIFRNQKQKGKYFLQGFQLERAVRSAAINGRARYKTDQDAFYTGGDLKGSKEIPQGLLEKDKNIEVKNLASNYGAQLASENTIETTLLTIHKICSNIQEKDLKSVLKNQIFDRKGDNKNIDKKLINAAKKSLEENVDKPIRDALKAAGVKLKN